MSTETDVALAPRRSDAVVPSAELGMSLFILTEIMFFAGLISGERPSWACSTCYSQDGGDQCRAYYATTLVLSRLPPLLFGGLVVWLYRAGRRSRPRA